MRSIIKSEGEMMNYKKIITLAVAVLMILPLLFGCGGYSSKYETVMEYNGIKLTEEFYYYWLSTYKRNILSSYTDATDSEEFWGSMYDDERTVEEYFTEIINQRIMNYLIAQDLYKGNTLKLSKSVKSGIKADIKEKIELYGGRAALNSTLSELMLNVDALEQVYLWEEKHDREYDFFFGAGGALEISDSDIIDYYKDNYYHIKYVVFYTTNIETDADGNYVYDSNGDLISAPLTDEERAQKENKIKEFEDKLSSGTSFDTLIKDYSEYDVSGYPNGFFFSSNELDIWGLDIYNAVKNADIGSTVRVEEDEAIFFVKRLELTDFSLLGDNDIQQIKGIVEYASSEVYNDLFDELSKNVKINKDVINRYKLSEIKANPNYSI